VEAHQGEGGDWCDRAEASEWSFDHPLELDQAGSWKDR
jgi:hypothetical protein